MGNMALHEPPSKPKSVGNSGSGKNVYKFVACHIESANLARVALSWALELKSLPIGHVGLKLGPEPSRWTPN